MEWSIGHIARKRALFTPEKTAVIFEDVPLTFLEINRKANQTAHYLKSAGMKKGDRVAVDLLNCPEFIYLYFAAAKLGLIFVPVNFRLVGPEVEYQLNNCGARMLFFHDFLTPVLEPLRTSIAVDVGKYIYLKSLSPMAFECPEWAVQYDTAVAGFSNSEPVPDQPVEIDDPLAIIYTSGVTGTPKGAVVSHHQTYFKNMQVMLRSALGPTDIYLTQLPLFHSAGLFISLTPCYNAGVTLLMRQNFDPVKFAKDIETYRATVVFALTTMWKFVLETKTLDTVDVSSVRQVTGGGERTPLSLIEDLAQRGLRMQQGFGQTENSAMTTLPKEDIFRKMGSAGIPGYFTDVWVAGDDFSPLPVGEIGEIVARGPTVMTGYWNMPEETAQTIINGILKTGDLGYMDEEGYLYIVDRVKFMYRSGGENVYPAEVEKILSAHPKIQHVAIIGVPDEKWGETGKAFVVPVPGQTITLQDLRDYLTGKIAKFKYPTQIETLDELPMTTSGKIKRAALQSTAANMNVAS